MKIIAKGKVKDVYDDGDTLVFRFSNRISVFDKIIPTEIENKGESLCRTSSFWFRYIGERGIKNHFIEMIDNRTMRVRKYDVPEKVSPGSSGYVIPLEFITRHYVAGSLYDRLKAGSTKPADIGLNHFPDYGEKLPSPVFEVTTKREKTDRLLDIDEALEISGLTREEYAEIRETILKIDEMMEQEVGKRGLIHADGKKEVALGKEREPIIVDTFGTADEDRFWEKKEYDAGRIVELSKEMVRQYYRSTGYHDRLYEARSRGMPEPDIPPLPEDMARKVSDLYKTMYERITGQKW
ncbi:phosphoribosylaminoimidazolesuccinocarboxamide synthase [Thermoplasma acidophilum]|uniref:Phosphoribosylaminoimidazole-succinocarboxamide synthase n=1 Tax=Thermoplasma acidophilum (strain ATCC 25905 / DSM 1728 / JCM 9062 / NBRC 15155 / AMRC-C165) TaxID=273075 RepID=PUR7_THEAC|nr:phosphoribosylaminoimidazolesuccinocarboxamide synthase [Thermoplasma acidophilum]Q9HLC0.2 RecName: Full=Phosphoribosylaminoimidazole-succinocarboxamide synthase; AltName: Full=SAICAR synthetase [Thermoplasma acidophilum DSM 1728]